LNSAWAHDERRPDHSKLASPKSKGRQKGIGAGMAGKQERVEAQGTWLIMRWAYGVPAHMIQLPVCFGLSESPVVFGSYGHMIM